MRSTLLFLLVALPAAAVVNALLATSELRRFSDEVRLIADAQHMARFRAVVARQMYAALAQIVLLGLPPVLFFGGLVLGELSISDVLYVILPAVVILVLALVLKRFETAAKSTPTATPELEKERDHVVETWLKKALPDW